MTKAGKLGATEVGGPFDLNGKRPRCEGLGQQGREHRLHSCGRLVSRRGEGRVVTRDTERRAAVRGGLKARVPLLDQRVGGAGLGAVRDDVGPD